MHRRVNISIKTGGLIFVFAILITSMFVGAMLWFGSMADQTQIEKGGIYLLSSLEYEEVVSNGGSLQMNAGNLIETGRYQSELLHRMLANLIPISFVFFTILFILSLFLWILLKQLHTRSMDKITKELEDSMSEMVLSNDPVLSVAYANLKEKFDHQLDDFKRLSAYLTHEQKNEIAILRTRMELSGNTDDLIKLDHLADSIDDILTLSENIDMTSQAVVDVSLICAEVFDSYQKTANNLYFEFNGDEDTEIVAKSRWIYRAVANLMDNAIKYGEGKPIILSVRAKNNSVIIKVRDHGIGIDVDKQEVVFNNRYRINELNKDGYGIGLSLVSHVCDLCKGFVTMESELKKGSTFYLAFPQKLF